MNVTPIYQLGYFIPNMVIGSNLDLDKNRFTTIENQLFNIYNIFGNGVVTQYDASGIKISSWNLSPSPNSSAVQVSSGQGHIAFVYCTTSSPVDIPLTLPAGTTSSFFYIYATKTATSPVDESVKFVASLTQINDPINYIGVGIVSLSYNASNNSFTVTVPSDKQAQNRQEISLYGTLTTLVKNHLHIGGANNPTPIDLAKHVKGFLSSDHIDQLDLAKVTQGTLDPNRLPPIDHNSLINIGTLTHAQIDSLLAALQSSSSYPGFNYKLSDYGIVNRLQIILALKRQTGFFNIDGEQVNSIFYAPYTVLSGFVDALNTSATIDTNVHRIFGVSGIARQSNVIKVNTAQQFQTALVYDKNNIVNPNVYNVTVTGVATDSTIGTINFPYAVAGSASTIYVASFADNYVSMFDYSGNFIKRSNNLDTVFNIGLNGPSSLFYDSSQDFLYVADTFNHRIIVTNGNLATLALIGNSNGSGQPGGFYQNSFINGFSYPKGVYGFGNTFYVADSGNNQIQKFRWNINGSVYAYVQDNVYKFISTSNTFFSPIIGLNSPLSEPRGVIATSYTGTNLLFVADFYNNRVLCGIETNNTLKLHQILGQNSGGNGFTTNLISSYIYPATSVVGLGATFNFNLSLDKNIFSIGVGNSGTNYNSGDKFYINYPGFPSNVNYFSVLTDGAGHITTAFVDYGISTNSSIGFNHPSSFALNIKSGRIDLLISDTENSRIVNYHGFTSVGLGTTNNQIAYTYNIGTAGFLTDTSGLIYFNKPAGIFTPLGFTTLLVADSLNNRIHSLTTTFAANSVIGIGTLDFGSADTSLTAGGVVLQKPVAYSTISTSFISATQPNPNWYFGDIVSPDPVYQYNSTQRYNFTIIPQQTLVNQDYVGFAFNTLNESFVDSCANLQTIGCYFILSTGGKTISFIETDYSNNSIGISSVYTIRSSSDTKTSFESTVPLLQFGMSTSPAIVGFGFVWTLSYLCEKVLWQLNSYSNTHLTTNYPLVAQQRITQGSTNDSIFVFNAGKYFTQGTYLYRFDAGSNGQARYDYVTFYFSTNAENLKFSYRYNDDLTVLNNTQSSPFLVTVNSGALVPLNVAGRYLDLQFDYSSDQLNTPVLSGIILYYSTLSQYSGIIYDTNVDNAQPGTYPRYKWNQGTYTNISITPIPNSQTQQYQIQIANSANVGLFEYLVPNTLNKSDLANNSVSEQSLIDTQNLYLSPWQVFSQFPPQAGLLNALHFSSDNASGFYIADTDNDRMLHIDYNGRFVKAVQGTIKLSRTQRDFVLLNCFYNPVNYYLFVVFSQYFSATTNYLNNVSLLINGNSYGFSNPSYFNSTYSGKYNVNANNQSCVLYIQATTQMDALIRNYSASTKLIIISPTTSFTVDPNGSYDKTTIPQGPENYSITNNTNTYPEFSPNLSYGIGTVITGVGTNIQNFADPVYFYTNTTGNINTTLVAYNSTSTNSFSVPVQVLTVYFQNIFKPLYIDSNNLNTIMLSCVGNYPIRCFDTNFNLLYTVSYPFNFNEILGGSAAVLDISSTVPDILLVSQVGTANTLLGSISVYKASTNTVLNNYSYNGFDVVQGIPYNNNFSLVLYDRQGNGLRSKLLQIGQDGTPISSVNNVFNKPVSVTVKENGFYYVTDSQGPLGKIFDRTFIGDLSVSGPVNSPSSSTSGSSSILLTSSTSSSSTTEVI